VTVEVESVDEVEVLPVVDPEPADVLVPVNEEPVVDVLRDCCFFSSATKALRFNFEDSSISPKRSVVQLGSLSLGAIRLKRARPRGLFGFE